jgi:hypothetical protein
MGNTDQDIADTINRYIGGALSGKTTRNEVIDAAFTAIQGDRQGYCLNDVAITSAEHYLFARLVVGEYFVMLWPVCATVFPGYDVIKAILGDRLAATKCPVSSYDWHHTVWKTFGCKDGSKDYWHPKYMPPERVIP